MELLQQPEIKGTYDNCKRKVKYWEHYFTKKHGRLPSKLDIREADIGIQVAYKTYFHIKSAALEQSFQDIDGFQSDEETADSNLSTPNISIVTSGGDIPDFTVSEPIIEDAQEELPLESVNTPKVWGAHLNNSAQAEKKKVMQKGANVNTSFTQKLFKNSSFSKRNPRKSLSFHHRKSETTLNSSKSLSQPEPSISIGEPSTDKENSCESEPFNLLNSVRMVKVLEPVQTQTLSAAHSMLDNKFRGSRGIDQGWAQRVTLTAGTKFNNMNNEGNFGFSEKLNVSSGSDSEDVIDDSDEETSMQHLAKRRRIDGVNSQGLEGSRSQILVGCYKSVDNVPSNQSLLGTNSESLAPINLNNTNNFSAGASLVAVSSKNGQTAVGGTANNACGENLVGFNDKNVPDLVQNAQSLVNLNRETQKIDNQLPLNSMPQNQNSPVHSNRIDEPEQMEVESPVGKGARRKVVRKKLPEREAVTKKIARKKPKAAGKKNIENLPCEPRKSARRVKKSVEPSENDENEAAPTRKTTRRVKKVVDLDLDSEPEDPFADHESGDPEYHPSTEKSATETFDFTDKDDVKIKTAKTKPKLKSKTKGKLEESKGTIEEEEPKEDAPYELEFSVKPRIVTVPRDPNLKNVIRARKKVAAVKADGTTAPEVKSRNDQNLDKLKKKVEAGNLNENFVRIDLRKKVYSRGKKTLNFSKYKKNMWKQRKKNNALAGPDMDMGGCDGGMLTCFNCGQVGHFARKCQAEKGDKLLPLTTADEEYCPFPTLEEASQMAQESNLAVRVPMSKRDQATADDEFIPGSSDDEDEAMVTEEPNSDDELLAEALKLEEYVKKIDMQQYIDSTRTVRPYYGLKEDGGIIDTPQEVFEALQLFGHTSFRPGQELAIMRILSGQSTLVTLSTGSGKSLCYQLPAYLYAKREPCISLIISPLVSLMEDQVTGIPAFLKAACLHTNKTKGQREKILEAISSGSLDVLLVSPEAVVAGEKSSGFGSLLRKLPPVAFACIDEAHCVSQWSHNFRPSYLMICRILKERLGIHTILGLTATATRATCDSIIHHISIPDGRDGIITDTPLPENLRLTVSKDGNRDHALLSLLLSERFQDLKSVIVYCTRRQECERIASFLRTSLKDERPTETSSKKRKKTNVQAEPYHAGLSASRRRTIQKNFMSGDLRIVVATVAFGMGINKSDIRAVIHYNLPKNFESYVQEVGRAGRDGLPAHCHLFLDPRGNDENELQRHVYSDSLDRHVIRKLLEKIFVPCSCKGICPKHEVAFSIQETVSLLDIPEENISTLMCYLELREERYIEVLSPSYVACKVIAYGGSNIIRKAAKDCPPLAMALVMFANDDAMENVFEFPVVDVAAAMGWDSGICKHKLKNLEWTNENGQSKRSFITVQFVNLGFRVLACGNLSGFQLDETLDQLYERVVDQERTALLQLHSLHDTVTSVAHQSYRTCISSGEATDKELTLKARIREYFDSPKPLSLIDLKEKTCDEGLITSDVRAVISMYRDNSFTGRAIARIFYGIPSPNYPAVIWGRSKFWRAHMNSDFNKVCKIATREILRMR